eukprot:scaffold992_cov116-Cylindrotheca_fusiformis.AAC.2
MFKNTLVVLTLEQHKDGIWIHRLIDSLQETAQLRGIFLDDNKGSIVEASVSKDCMISIKVQSLESWLREGWIVSSDCFEGIIGIVNRVSDAASPPLFKACCAILSAARVMNIPVVNGPEAYALCGNKWCHHILFGQAGLSSPTTIAFWKDEDSKSPGVEQETTSASGILDDGTSLLIKPNAGGFGAGICRAVAPIQDDLPTFEDSMTLVQQYHPPQDGRLYRVWFLEGKVQCAIERLVQNEEDHFTSACSGSCSLSEPPKAWSVPTQVCSDIEDQLLPLLVDAHCGSVEFLHSGNDRLYFDLNLLSTLPIRFSDPNAIWEKDYDPWKELAEVVWEVVLRN